MRNVLNITLSFLILLAGCSSPTAPRVEASSLDRTLAGGQWMGNDTAACMTVAEAEVELISGCWHGRFARPVVGPAGTFSVTGSYQFEAGPVKIEPPPAARFTGTLSGTTLTIRVERVDQTVPPTEYSFTLSENGRCARLCA